MARLNPKRRRMAKQAELLQSIIREHGPTHDDSHLLQRGSPRTSVMKYSNAVNMRGPNFSSLAPSWYKDGPKAVYQGDKGGPVKGKVFQGRK